MPPVVQVVLAVCLDTEEPGDTLPRASMRRSNLLAQCIGSLRGSEAYDNTDDPFAEEKGHVDDQRSERSDDLQHESLTRTGSCVKSGCEGCGGILTSNLHRNSLQKGQSCGGGSSAAESLAAQGDCLLHPPGVWAGVFLGGLLVGSSWEPRLLIG